MQIAGAGMRDREKNLLASFIVWGIENDTLLMDNGRPVVIVPLSGDWGLTRWQIYDAIARIVRSGVEIERVRSYRTTLIIYLDTIQDNTVPALSMAIHAAHNSVRPVDEAIDWTLGQPTQNRNNDQNPNPTSYKSVNDASNGNGARNCNLGTGITTLGSKLLAGEPLDRPISRVFCVLDLKTLRAINTKYLLPKSLSFSFIVREKITAGYPIRVLVSRLPWLEKKVSRPDNSDTAHVSRALLDLKTALCVEADEAGASSESKRRYYAHPFVTAWASIFGIKPYLLREPWRTVLAAMPTDRKSVRRWANAIAHLRAAHGLKNPWRIGLMLEVYAGTCPGCAAQKRRRENNG